MSKTTSVKFKNEDGEEFELAIACGYVSFRGDETSGEWIDLFNPKFNLWTDKELKQVARALIKLSEAS